MAATHSAIPRPETGEFNPYYERYISLVPGDPLGMLEHQEREFVERLASRAGDGTFRYAPDKWSIMEVVGHVNDAERIFAYRILRISRADLTPIEGFEQDDYVRNFAFEQVGLSGLVEEFRAVRRASLSLLRNLTPEAWTRRGTANKDQISVRALAYIMAGHTAHHLSVLDNKYFAQMPAASRIEDGRGI